MCQQPTSLRGTALSVVAVLYGVFLVANAVALNSVMQPVKDERIGTLEKQAAALKEFTDAIKEAKLRDRLTKLENRVDERSADIAEIKEQLQYVSRLLISLTIGALGNIVIIVIQHRATQRVIAVVEKGHKK